MLTLRPYQEQAIQEMRNEWYEGKTKILLYAPTGAGKTIMAGGVIQGAYQKGKIVWFVCHRRELIFQGSNKLSEFGIPHSIVLSGEEHSPYERVYVGSVQTLDSWVFKKEKIEIPEPDVIVFDEAHHAVSNTWKQIVDKFPQAAVIGLSATPVRADGKGLGHIFQSMVMAPSISELTENNFLVPVKYYAPSIPDLWGVKVQAGDYNLNQLGQVMDKKKLVGDIVSNWGRICPDRKTVIFATTVAHSLHIKEIFEAEGVAIEHIDGNTPKEERDYILKSLKRGDIQIVTNCQVLTEGWDEPSVSCCILARPTKSLGLYLQMVGRVLRPFEGKSDTILIDHSGAVYEHGFLDQEFDWSLDTREKLSDRVAKKKKSEPKPITCEKCFTIYEKSRVCPACGHMPEKKAKYLAHTDAELGEITGGKTKKKVYSQQEKQDWYSMLLCIQKEKGYKSGWVANQYRNKFGVWPRGMNEVWMPPSIEVTRWIKHQQIKFYKAKEKGSLKNAA